MRHLRKLSELLRLLPGQPREFFDRVVNMAQARLDKRSATHSYQHGRRDEALRDVADRLGANLEWLDEPAARLLREEVQSQLSELATGRSFDEKHNADLTLAQLCYLVCRATRPAIVVETGVAHGVTSAFILAALETNQHGVLHSIDLPPLHEHQKELVGSAVPQRLRSRWTLHLGSSRRLLPAVLAKAGGVDVFVHDSLHTRSHMRWEFGQAWVHMRAGSVLIADDIEGNSAWTGVVARQPAFERVIPQSSKRALCGLAVK